MTDLLYKDFRCPICNKKLAEYKRGIPSYVRIKCGRCKAVCELIKV